MPPNYVKSAECPYCGGPRLYWTRAHSGDATTAGGETVELGNRVLVCEDCGTLARKAKEPKAASRRKRSASAKRKPAARKTATARKKTGKKARR